jgi:hypothetical protein
MTRRATLFLALAIVLALFAFAAKPEEAILGKWIDSEGDTWEFFRDGTGTMTRKGSPWGAPFKYTFGESNRMKVDMGLGVVFVVKVAIRGDEMTWWLPDEPNEDPQRFRRATSASNPEARESGLADSRQRQQRTMVDIRSIAVAMEAYSVDFLHYPKVSLADQPVSKLAPYLEPTYIQKLPTRDGWNREILVTNDANGLSYTIYSRGKDGIKDSTWTQGPKASFDADIVFSNGQFYQWPEGQQI